jgi:hypothetical protein
MDYVPVLHTPGGNGAPATTLHTAFYYRFLLYWTGQSTKQAYKRSRGYPLACSGVDMLSNMQWLSVADRCEKDRIKRKMVVSSHIR